VGESAAPFGRTVWGAMPFFAAFSSWKAVVPLVTRRALQDA
jgi:hypothetical protein